MLTRLSRRAFSTARTLNIAAMASAASAASAAATEGKQPAPAAAAPASAAPAPGSFALKDLTWVTDKLQWMRQEKIWPNGLRYLWTDAFGVVLLVSLYHETGQVEYLQQAEWVVAEVRRVLGRAKGYRIGQAPDRDGQYFHYLAVWMYAMSVLGRVLPAYRELGIQCALDVHDAFYFPPRGHGSGSGGGDRQPRGATAGGFWWKMNEDLSGPHPDGYGLGSMDAFDAYTAYKSLDPGGAVLGRQTAQALQLVENAVRDGGRHLHIDQDLGLGMMLWMASLYPEEPWARIVNTVCFSDITKLWVPIAEPPGQPQQQQKKGYFARARYARSTVVAFANYGVGLGLQSLAAQVADDHAANAAAAAVGSSTSTSSSTSSAGAGSGAGGASHALRLPSLMACPILLEHVLAMHAFFDCYSSGDKYDREAITWVMGCVSHFPGAFLKGYAAQLQPLPQAAQQQGGGAPAMQAANASSQQGPPPLPPLPPQPPAAAPAPAHKQPQQQQPQQQGT